MKVERKHTSWILPIYAVLLVVIIVYYAGFRNTSTHITTDKYYKWRPPQVSAPKSDGYLVWDKMCKIPEVNPFTREQSRLKRDTIFNRKCSTNRERERPLVTKLYDSNTQVYYLHINRQWEPLYLNDSSEHAICCYREIVRVEVNVTTDSHYDLLPCFTFDQDFEVPVDVDGVIVHCKSSALVGLTKTSVFSDAFFFVQTPARNGKVELKTDFGILLLGISGLSQMGLRRSLPKTYEYLQTERNKWYELSGYNQLGDDTYTSLTTLLTGLQPQDVWRECNRQHSDPSKCPYLWQHARDLGFITAHAEDTAAAQLINPSTDYSLHSFMSAIEQHLKSSQPFAMHDCLGPRLAADYIYDYALEYAQRLEGRASFGVFWLNTVHQHFDRSELMDERLLTFMRQLESKALLERYVVLLYSDHGAQANRLYDILTGFYEERLPMFFMSLPSILRHQRPEFVFALILNRNRLASPLDVHVTLHHLLATARTSDWNNTRLANCPDCQSVLQPLKVNRSCAQAGIDWYACSCEPFETTEKSAPDAHSMTKFLLLRLNELLRKSNLLNGTCQPFQLKKVKVCTIYVSRHKPTYHYIKLKTFPSGVIFELAFWFETDAVVVLDGSKVKRIGEGNTTCLSAIENPLYKKLCICNDSNY